MSHGPEVLTKPSEVVFSVSQPKIFSRVCASWFPTPSGRSNENEESPRRLHGFGQARNIRTADLDKITSINGRRIRHRLNLF